MVANGPPSALSFENPWTTNDTDAATPKGVPCRSTCPPATVGAPSTQVRAEPYGISVYVYLNTPLPDFSFAAPAEVAPE